MTLKSLFLLLLVSLTIYYAESVTCDFKKSTNDDDYDDDYDNNDDDGLSYGCELLNQSIESESDLSRIDGDHMQGMTDVHVAWIESTDSRIRFFPNVLIEHFPNLTRAAFHNSQMTSFGRPINCGKLEHIGLDDNLLTDIPYGTFTNCSQLITLDLSQNNLESISEHSFSALTELSSLNLMQNRIRSIHPNTFSSLENLENINLNSNEIETLNPNLFENTTSLSVVLLGNNHISSLPDNFLGDNTFLTYLNLSSNRIRKVGAKLFGPRKGYLESIDLSNNLIKELPIFQGITSLKQLNLQNNKIRRITPRTFERFDSVRMLNLANNRIETLDSGSFTELTHLQYLYLNSNIITEIEPKTFDRFVYLHELWLSDNQLKVLKASSFEKSSLKTLRIERNKIERIEGDLFDVFPHLSTLNLTGNICADEFFSISAYDQEERNHPVLGTCRTSSLNSLPLSLLSVTLIACLIL